MNRRNFIKATTGAVIAATSTVAVSTAPMVGRSFIVDIYDDIIEDQSQGEEYERNEQGE